MKKKNEEKNIHTEPNRTEKENIVLKKM